jgi:hypothetical protein
MKKTGLVLLGLAFAILTNAQVIKIQGGTSFSTLNWKLNINGAAIAPFYNETLIGYSFFAGVDYVDKKYFNLSGNIGFISKGGKSETQLTDQYGETYGTVTEKPTLNYLSVNTTVDLKYRIKEMIIPFIGFGPRVDYLISNSKQFDGLKEPEELHKISVGLIAGGGLKYNLSAFQFGLRADYYLDFTKVAEWTIESTRSSGEITVNTFSINLTVGYNLK